MSQRNRIAVTRRPNGVATGGEVGLGRGARFAGERPATLALWVSAAYGASALLVVLAAERLLTLTLIGAPAAGAVIHAANLGFVAATTLLAYLALRVGFGRIDRGLGRPSPQDDADDSRKAHEAALAGGWKPFVLVFAVLSSAFAATAGYVNLRQEKLAIEIGKERIEALAGAKSVQVRRWLHERRRSLEQLATHPEFVDRAERSFDPHDGSDRLRELLMGRLETMVEVHDYIGATLFDATGKARARAGAQGPDRCSADRVAGAIRDGEPAFGGLEVGKSGTPWLELIVALTTADAKPAGAICVQIDPRRDLFPMIEDRPSAARTGESHLVRSDGEKIVHLTGARGSSLVPEGASPAASGSAFGAWSAPAGLVSGVISWVDERGEQVLAAIHPIAATPWAVASKVERGDLLERQRDLAIWSGAMVAAFVVVATAAAMLVARYHGLRLLRSARRRNARLSLRDRHFGMLARHANDIILLMDDQGAIIEANERAEAVYGYTREQLRGMHAFDLRADDHPDLYDAQWATVEAEEGAVFEARQKRSDGSSFPVELSVRAMEVEGVRYRQAIVRDLTERQQLSERLRFLARHDELTGLANRSSFVEALEAALARARRNNGEVAVMFVDLDDFKAVNDTAGHAAGDEVLQQFARRLESSLRETDFVARLGGDEFCVLMESSPERSNVEMVARKILAAVAVEFRVEQGVFRLGASIGVSRFPDDGDQPGELLKCADSAMYEAKLAGKNAYRAYRRR